MRPVSGNPTASRRSSGARVAAALVVKGSEYVRTFG